ncbi:MAG: YqjF family protein [Gemmataceae bacterium]
MKFLTARWSNLFLVNYVVPPELLTPLLPAGLELDRRDGHSFASLVAFNFLDTKVLGVPWPGYRNFPELNLRFYVRHGDRRGVVFVREFVPRRLVAWTARTLYNEPYRSAPMRSRVNEENNRLTFELQIDYGGRPHVLQAIGAKPASRPAVESVEHFFKEHEWGFNTSHRGTTMRYRVEHPVWDVYRVLEHHIDVDWGMLYGPKWKVMQAAMPDSTVLAVGSEVTVYSGTALPPKPV